MFWKNFYFLCTQKGMKPAQVVKDIGISGGSPTQWKNGRIPSKKTLTILANYFEVDTEYFFIDHTDPINLSEEEKRLIAAYRNQSEEGKKMVRKLLDLEEPTNRVIDDLTNDVDVGADREEPLATSINKAFTHHGS